VITISFNIIARKVWLKYYNRRVEKNYLDRMNNIKGEYKISGIGGDSKRSWENSFISMLEPVLDKFSEGGSMVNIVGPQKSIWGSDSDGYEGFARTFLGTSFFLHRRKESRIKTRKGIVDIAEVYRKGIINGTDRTSPEYWGKIKATQRVVENASVGIGLLLSHEHIWKKLSEDEKENVARWFRKNLKGEYSLNNWQWFRVFHHIFLENTGFSTGGSTEEALDNIEKMYVGDGWYSDGIKKGEYHYDYYVAWAMQFYALLFSYLASEKYEKSKKIYVERAARFMKDYCYFFTPGWHNVPYGRSQVYRFASLAPFGVFLLLKPYRDIAWIKTCATDTINSFIDNHAFNKEGILSMGQYDAFVPMLEAYSGPGSPYWAFKGFSFLMLPDNHAFWHNKRTGREKMVHAIPRTSMLLCHDGKSQVIMLNAGSSNMCYTDRYNKFAYSNRFIHNFGKCFDNTLMLKFSNEWRGRGRIIKNMCIGNMCDFTWTPYKNKDFPLRTILLGGYKSYLALHSAEKDVRFKAGGFPLACEKDNVEENKEKSGVSVGSGSERVGMDLIFGDAEPLIQRDVNKNPKAKFSFTPCFEGTLSGKICYVAWTGKAEKTDVKIDGNTVKIEWLGKDYTFLL